MMLNVIILTACVYAAVPKWAQDMLDLHNKFRADNGLKPLCLNAKLMDATNKQAQFLKGKLQHTGPNGNNPSDRCAAAGYKTGGCAENAGSPEWNAKSLFEAFINEKPPEDGHRKNVLSAQALQLGVGGEDMSDTHKGTWVLDYGSDPNEPCLPASGSLPSAPNDKPAPAPKPKASNPAVANPKAAQPAGDNTKTANPAADNTQGNDSLSSKNEANRLLKAISDTVKQKWAQKGTHDKLLKSLRDYLANLQSGK